MKPVSIFSILLVGIFLLSSCSEKSVRVNNDDGIKKSSSNEKPSGEASKVFDNVAQVNDPEEDCHGKRAVGQTLEEVEGIIMRISGKYVITANNGNRRYNPCKLPENLSKEGLPVRFTGEVLEIFPGERLFASPFRLRNIEERD